MADSNGSGKRACKDGFINAFIAYTENLEAAPIFRLWAAIAIIGAVLEQKVYLQTSAPLYPNPYIFLVGHPGVGKTRTISAAASFLREIPEFHLSPTSMSAASLVDALMDAKRTIVQMPEPMIEYNSMAIVADELSAFMHEFATEMMGNLTTFYDVVPYGHSRRGRDIKIKIKRPQLSILCGTTPSNLMKFMPEQAWDQGFTSRTIMVFSDERIVSEDVFALAFRKLPEDALRDLKTINTLIGGFKVTQEYKDAVNNWRKLGQPPIPTHPKLLHYSTRRLAHLFKLSMVSAADNGNDLLLMKGDFNRALGWMIQAEDMMPDIFRAGSVGADSKAMEELMHCCMINDRGEGVPETMLARRAAELVPVTSVQRLLEVMVQAGMLRVYKIHSKMRFFKSPSTGRTQ